MKCKFVVFQYSSFQFYFQIDVEDFDIMTQHIFFFQDEDVFRVDCQNAYVPIADDDVNEAEQVFGVHLSIVPLNVQNPGKITLSQNASLAKIIDDDREFQTSSDLS